jgi:hypothetical protein
MSTQPLGEDLDCSDQRLIFRLLLAEVRRVRKLAFSAECILSAATTDYRERAIATLKEAVPRAPSRYEWNDSLKGGFISEPKKKRKGRK